MNANTQIWNRGLVGDKQLVCQYKDIDSSIVANKHGPFQNSSIILIYFVVIFLITRATHTILRLLHQNLLTAQILAGILIGPSFLTRNPVIYDKLFPPGGTVILKTFGYFGVIIHLFGLGVNSNYITMIRNVGKKVIIIGLTSYFSGMSASFLTLHILTKNNNNNSNFFDKNPILGIPILVSLNSNSPFIVMTAVLVELKMINSDLGKLVSSISIVCDICGWLIAGFMSVISKSIQNKHGEEAKFIVFCIIAYYSTIFLILRPLVIYIAKQTPEGKPMNEGNFFIILILVLGVAFIGEVIGQSSGLAAFIFGLTLPDGPPLGMTLIDKFDTITTGLLLPIFCIVSGLRTNLHTLTKTSTLYFGSIILMGYLGKFLGTLLATIVIGKVSLNTAISLALVLCCKGVVELSAYGMFKDSKLLTDEAFSLAILIMLVVTGVSIPIVKYLYDPSSKYMSKRKQTIVNSDYLEVIKILVCIYKEDNVAPIIQLLQIAKPRKETPLQVLVLQLFELVGSKQAMLAPYDPNDTSSSHIVSAFKRLEKEKNGNLRTQHFTSTSPYSSMHDDICSVAFDQGINVIILPFHQNHGFDKAFTEGSNLRNVNRRVMRKAPCSVGVLIDKKSLKMSSFYSIVVLFLGGNDDHETLAYSRRMVEDSSINLTVMRIKSSSSPNDLEEINDEADSIDEYIINDFLASTKNKSNVMFKQTIVEDGVGTIQIIRTIEEHVDLVLVGRYHDPKMLAITGLMDWSKWPELGAIGAMLTTWDFQFSVLVIQQQQQQQKHGKLFSSSRQNSTNSLFSLDDNQSMSSMSNRDNNDYFIVQEGKPFQYFKFSQN